MLNCPNCGAALSIDDLKCPFCGTEHPDAVAHKEHEDDQYWQALIDGHNLTTKTVGMPASKSS